LFHTIKKPCGILVKKVALKEVILLAFLFCCATVTPPVLRSIQPLSEVQTIGQYRPQFGCKRLTPYKHKNKEEYT
jgi:hypothetical protein